MNIKNISFVLLITLCSCRTQVIDEKSAIEIVKKHLSLSGEISAQVLKGGYSGAQLFVVTSESKKYVIRFSRKNKSQKYIETEIYNLKVASDAGYAPKIYFADPSQGTVIMEYLAGKVFSPQELARYLVDNATSDSYPQTDQFYVLIAHLLQKIHTGPAFENSGYDVFGWIDNVIQTNKSKYSDYISMTKLEQNIAVIRQTLLPYLVTNVPCHNDFYQGNLIFMGSEVKAIDYEKASQGDPYFDIATAVVSFYTNPTHENLLLTTYLGRQPSAFEIAKLYLMKQVVLINWVLHGLVFLSPENLQKYGLTKRYSITDLAKEIVAGKIDFSKTEDSLKLLKARSMQMFDNFESQEFKDAVNILNRTGYGYV